MITKWFNFVVVLLVLVVSTPLLSETLAKQTNGHWSSKPTKIDAEEVEDRMYQWTVEDLEEMCHLWPQAVVFYNNLTSVNDEIQSTIKKAMKLISSLTCVKFEQVGLKKDQSYVNIEQTNGFDCNSSIGRQCTINGGNEFKLSDKCAPLFGFALRGWLKTLGIHSQHLRNDRDNYVTILEKKIPESMVYLFKKHNKTMQESYYGDYDYCSITHDSSNIWSNTEEDVTIITNDKSYQSVIGQTKGLSFGDIKLINKLYSCSEDCQANLTCARDCYLNKECKCSCPKKVSPGECELYKEPNEMPREEEPTEEKIYINYAMPMIMPFNQGSSDNNKTLPVQPTTFNYAETNAQFMTTQEDTNEQKDTGENSELMMSSGSVKRAPNNKDFMPMVIFPFFMQDGMRSKNQKNMKEKSQKSKIQSQKPKSKRGEKMQTYMKSKEKKGNIYRETIAKESRKEKKKRKGDKILTTVQKDGTLRQIHKITHAKSFKLKIDNRHAGKEVYVFQNAKKKSNKRRLKFILRKYDVGNYGLKCKSYFTYKVVYFYSSHPICGKMYNKKGINKETITDGRTAAIEVTKDGSGGWFTLKGKVKIHS